MPVKEYRVHIEGDVKVYASTPMEAQAIIGCLGAGPTELENLKIGEVVETRETTEFLCWDAEELKG